MAFRKRFKRHFRRSFRAPVARVRRTWITSMLPTVCNFLEAPLVDCGELNHSSSKSRYILFNESTLQDKFSDRAKVVRIVGDFLFAPAWDATVGGACVDDFLAAMSAYGQGFIGLRRYERNAAGFQLEVSPLENDADYSESQWLKTWQHFWVPKAGMTLVPEHISKTCAIAICSDTHTTGLTDNIFTEGTGTINIETDCTNYGPVECSATQDNMCERYVDFPQPWKVHFDLKKRIPLRENHELALELSVMWPNATQLVNPRIQVMGGIKSLIQY